MIFPAACATCLIGGALLALLVQQIYWLEIERIHQRRVQRKAKIARMREPVFPSPDERKILLYQFGAICRELMNDSANKLALRRQGDLILRELAA